MNTANDRKKTSRIIIVGSNRMQIELMASFLQSNLGFVSNHCMPENLTNCYDVQSEHKILYLFDAQNIDWDMLSVFFNKAIDIANANRLSAVYNLDPYTKINKQVIDGHLQRIFYKNEPLENVSEGIRTILGDRDGKKPVVSKMPVRGNKKKLKGELSNVLTVREKDILLKLYSGDSNKKIAEDLGVSFYTVKSHISNILRKINVNSRFRATIWAAHHL